MISQHQTQMAITSALNSINIGFNICQAILQKMAKNIAGLTITMTPLVGVIVEVNIFLRPGRNHVGNWWKLVSKFNNKFCSWEIQLKLHIRINRMRSLHAKINQEVPDSEGEASTRNHHTKCSKDYRTLLTIKWSKYQTNSSTLKEPTSKKEKLNSLPLDF